MANIDAPHGLTPVFNLDMTPWSGGTWRCHIPATDSVAVYIGGLVALAGSADADGVATVQGNISTGGAVFGVVTGVEPVTDESLTYRAASTARYVFVAPAATTIFKVQDDSDAADLAATDVGSVGDLTGFTSGTAATGRSIIEIDESTVATGGDGTEDVVILGLWQAPDNSIGTNAEWIVKLNNIQLIDGFAGI